MEEFIGIIVSILPGVVVSLFTLAIAARQRAKDERQAEPRRRKAILAGLGRELQWNRSATKDLDASNAYFRVGSLTTVAFERHGAELATIAPEGVEHVFNHYSTVGTVQDGIRIMGGRLNLQADEVLKRQWIELSQLASVGVSNSATAALISLDLPLDPQECSDKPDGSM